MLIPFQVENVFGLSEFSIPGLYWDGLDTALLKKTFRPHGNQHFVVFRPADISIFAA